MERRYPAFRWLALRWLQWIFKKGIILEVDLECPEELHDSHNDYPCAAEKLNVSDDTLSDYCSNIKNLHKMSSGNVKRNFLQHYLSYLNMSYITET